VALRRWYRDCYAAISCGHDGASLDGEFEGPAGHADWVDAWSGDFEISAYAVACLLGAGMYPGYEQYWTAMQNEPETPLPMTGNLLPNPKRLCCSFAPYVSFRNHIIAVRTPSVHPLSISRIDCNARLRSGLIFG
jgi:hypothetical protein